MTSFTFTLPKLQPENGNFGPALDNVPAAFSEIPYQSFNKSERLGTIVDWSGDTSRDKYGQGSYGKLRAGAAESKDAAGGLYAYRHDEDEASFSLVAGASSNSRRTGGAGLGALGRGNYRGGRGGGRNAYGNNARTGGYYSNNARGNRDGRFDRQPRGGAGRRGGGRGFSSGWGGGRDWVNREQRTREASVQAGPDWVVLEEIDFTRLAKLRLEVDTEEVETLSQHGFLYEYDRVYDRVNTKQEKPLQHLQRLHYNPTTSDDPVIQDLAAKDRAQVFTTDSILTMIMCSPRSLYPWDLVLIREGDKLFIDKRDQGPLDFLSVNENAQEPPLESEREGGINTPSALSQEATFVNDLFGWQLVREEPASKLDFEHPNPFYSTEENLPLASCGYRYRKFDLSITENEAVELVVRTEVDALLRGGTATTAAGQAAAPGSNEEAYISLKTLFEFDSRAPGSGGAVDWRTKLDTQRGAVIATEMRNNSCKLARWAVGAILAGAEQMKVGYVSRQNPRDENRHVILGTQWFKPRDFAAQMNVNLANGWGIVRTIIDLCLAQPEGKYVLLKDPNKPVIRLYRVPFGAFEEDEEVEEEEPLRSDEDMS